MDRAGTPPDDRDASRRFDEALTAARREGRGTGGPAVRRVHGGPQEPVGPRDLGDADPDLPGVTRSPTGGVPGQLAADSAAPAPPAASLPAAVRALPAAIEAARLRDGVEIALLGGALGVELRGRVGGVELTLRPALELGLAATAELPRLVAALRARGVRVARAEVRGEPRRRRPTVQREGRAR